MTPREWILIGSVLAILGGFGLLVAVFWPEPVEVEERIEEAEAAVPDLPPLVPLKTAAEVAEVKDKTAWLATMAEAMTVADDLTGHELVPDERPCGPLLCHRPARPAEGTELWWTIRLAAMRQRPANWRRLGKAIGPDWSAMVAEDEELTAAADTAVWAHLTETALTDTQEITAQQLAKVLGGVR